MIFSHLLLLCTCVIMNFYVGKTTLKNTMIRCITDGSTFHKLFLIPIKDFLSKLMDGLRQTQRTCGIEISELKEMDGVNLAIWDMAGQEEFHSFHDFMFPNLNGTSYPSIFLLVCSQIKQEEGKPQKDILDIRKELEYWLRFIASKNRRSNIFKPKAIVVLTHADKIGGLNVRAKGVVADLRSKFTEVVDVSLETFVVNSHSSSSSRVLVQSIQNNVQDLLNALPPVYQVCTTMKLALKDWMSQHPNNPLMSQDTFSKLCQKLPDLAIVDQNAIKLILKSIEDRRKVVAKWLHMSGDILFFEDLDFIVVDVQWFCHQVMGHLIKLSHDQMHVTSHSSAFTNENGFTTKDYFQDILDASVKVLRKGKLQNVQTEYLIQLMLKLELCFEKTRGYLDDGLFIPTTLTNQGIKGEWDWPSSNNSSKMIYFGRRLECDDEECAFIPPGFFCRLQVCENLKFWF